MTMIKSKCAHCGRELDFPEGAAIKLQCASCDSRDYEFDRKVKAECRNGHARKLSGNFPQDMNCIECRRNPKISNVNLFWHVWYIKAKDFDEELEKEKETEEVSSKKPGIKIRRRKKK